MADKIVPAAPAAEEIIVKGSRFIAAIAPAFSVSDAREFIKSARQEHPQATHHVPVYLIGHGASVTAHCSDAGEPSGTAGRPALAVLQGSGLGDAVLVITRYFGGTKLGTGGLVKAYSEAARQAIRAVPKAKKIPVHDFSLQCHYNIYEKIVRLLASFQGEVQREDFADTVTLRLSIPASGFEQFSQTAKDLSCGQIQLDLIGQNRVALVAIPDNHP